MAVDEDQESALAKAKDIPSVARAIAEKRLVKEIYIKGKIINLVVK